MLTNVVGDGQALPKGVQAEPHPADVRPRAGPAAVHDVFARQGAKPAAARADPAVAPLPPAKAADLSLQAGVAAQVANALGEGAQAVGPPDLSSIPPETIAGIHAKYDPYGSLADQMIEQLAEGSKPQQPKLTVPQGNWDNGGGGGGGDSGCPVMLDLNGDGSIGVTGLSTARNHHGTIRPTVDFDLDGDGSLDHIEWSSGNGDGILVDDRDGGATKAMNGSQVINGKRLFGDEGGAYASGYERLAQLDANHDGKLTGSELDGLKIWIDDGDAKLEPGELKTLAELHVSELSVRMDLVMNQRGETLMRGTFTRNGEQQMSEDVWFGIDGNPAPRSPNFARHLTRAAANLTAADHLELATAMTRRSSDARELSDDLRRQRDTRELADAAEQRHQGATVGRA
jgi:hypothetical protein